MYDFNFPKNLSQPNTFFNLFVALAIPFSKDYISSKISIFSAQPD